MSWRVPLLVAVLAVLVFNFSPLYSYGTIVGDSNVIVIDHDITSDTVWPGGYTYLIVGDIRVDFDVNLTVDSGAIILFTNGSSLEVDGLMTIMGSSDAPVYIEGDNGSTMWRLFVDAGEIIASYIESDTVYMTARGNLTIWKSNIGSLIFEPYIGDCASTANIYLLDTVVDQILFNCTNALTFFSNMRITRSVVGNLIALDILVEDSSLVVEDSVIDYIKAKRLSYSHADMVFRNSSIGKISGLLADYTSTLSIINSNVSEIHGETTSSYYASIGLSSKVYINESNISGNFTIRVQHLPALDNGKLSISNSNIDGFLIIEGADYAIDSNSQINIENTTVGGFIISAERANQNVLGGIIKDSKIQLRGSHIRRGVSMKAGSEIIYSLWSSILEIQDSNISGDITIEGETSDSQIYVDRTVVKGNVTFIARNSDDAFCCSSIIVGKSNISGLLLLLGKRNTISGSSIIHVNESTLGGVLLSAIEGEQGRVWGGEITIENSHVLRMINISGTYSRGLEINIYRSIVEDEISVLSSMEESRVTINRSSIGFLRLANTTGSIIYVHLSNISGGVFVHASSDCDVNLTYNWWGSLIGPRIEGLWPSTGALLSGTTENIEWSPWLTEPATDEADLSGGPIVTIDVSKDTVVDEWITFNAYADSIGCRISHYLFSPGTAEVLYNRSSPVFNYTYSKPGVYTIVIAAFDECGLAGAGITRINVSMTPEPPSISIVYPNNDTITNKSEITILWNVSWPYDPSETGHIDIYIDEEEVASLCPKETTYTVSLEDGVHTIKIVAYMEGIGQNTTSLTITVDATPPTINASVNVSNSTVVINWRITEENIAGVKVLLNGVVIYYGVELEGIINSTLREGANNIMIKAMDKAGNTAVWSQVINYNPSLHPPLEENQTTQITATSQETIETSQNYSTSSIIDQDYTGENDTNGTPAGSLKILAIAAAVALLAIAAVLLVKRF